MMRALAVLLAAAAVGGAAAAEAQALGTELLRNGALFDVKMRSMCPASPKGSVVQLVLDDAIAAMVPADPQVNAADSAAVAKAKEDVKRGLKTLKVIQYVCAGDIRNLCQIGDRAKRTCPERVFAACPECFPRNTTINKQCMCTCEKKPELKECFLPKPTPKPSSSKPTTTSKPTSKPTINGRLLRAGSLEEELIELAQRRALEEELIGEDDSMGESVGTMSSKNKTARAELAGAMRAVKTCFENKAAQLSQPCRNAMTVLNNQNVKRNTTRPPKTAPPTACCQPAKTPKPTLPKQNKTMTRKPTPAGMTRKPTPAGMTRKPTTAGTTRKPTVAGTNPKPTAKPAGKPTVAGNKTVASEGVTNAVVDPESSAYSDTSAYSDGDELLAGVDMSTAMEEDLMSEPVDGTTAETLSDPVADAAFAIETADFETADVKPIPDDVKPNQPNPAPIDASPASSPMPAGAAVGLSAGAIALVAALFVGGKAAARLKADRAAHKAEPELAVAAPKDQDAPAEPASSTGGSSAVDAESGSAASAPAESSGAERQSRKERKERSSRKDKTIRKDEPAIDPETDL